VGGRPGRGGKELCCGRGRSHVTCLGVGGVEQGAVLRGGLETGCGAS